MKLLVVTQKVDENDPILGFFHLWLKEFAKKFDLVVIGNEVGSYNLPPNIEIFSLGKEMGASRILRALRYQRLILKNIAGADCLFFHMCPIYAVAAGLWVKLFNKKSYLWFVHRGVTWKLWLASKIVSRVLNVETTGHGIDTNTFRPGPELKKPTEIFSIIAVGRISSIKNYEVLLEIARILKQKEKKFHLKFVGAPLNKNDEVYFDSLKRFITDNNLSAEIGFIGAVPNREMPKIYKESDLLVNLTTAGSFDKVILEAMACGTLVLTANPAFKNAVPDVLVGDLDNTQDLAEKMEVIINFSNTEREKFQRQLVNYVSQNHSLEQFVNKLSDYVRD